MANTIDDRLPARPAGGLAAQLADQQRQARMAEEDKGRQGAGGGEAGRDG